MYTNAGEVYGFKVLEMLPECQKQHVKDGVLIAHVSTREKFGAVKKKGGEKFQFKGRLLKVGSGMKLGDNRRLGVFLQVNLKIVYHMIILDLEKGERIRMTSKDKKFGGRRPGEEERKGKEKKE